MLVQVRTDDNVEGHEELAARTEEIVSDSLERFADRVTRVQVHFGDENSEKKSGPDDKRCALELRLAGINPVATRAHAPTYDQALAAALDKVQRAADRVIERKHARERT